ncbi:hypothetical protein FQR65_LT06436 [Abscondita terminalis]|nr:hypothetical protein FQR65_LT06436 [Abscondita terminalis]
MNKKRNHSEGEQNQLRLTIADQTHQEGPESAHQKIAEIQDIYDSIYGIVQSKLEFYENKKGKSPSRPNTPIRNVSYEYTEDQKRHSQIDFSSSNLKSQFSNSSNNLELNISNSSDDPVFNFNGSNLDVRETPSTPPTPAVRKNRLETATNPDLLSNCSLKCSKCVPVDFTNERHEVLTEMNAELKVELDIIKKNLKQEIEKNNELNFEIANIETALEMYYNEAKYQKSTISAIYSSVKNYSSNKNENRERYTYRRIKAVSDYVETLKAKLQHQDRIIKDNFLDNPYSTDMMMKYDSVRQQLDKLSGDNQDLKNEIKKRQEEEIEIIKELNRQKFQIEEKSRETEAFYKNELAAKDDLITNLHDTHKREMKEVQDKLDREIEQMSKIKAIYDAKISNYKEELKIPKVSTTGKAITMSLEGSLLNITKKIVKNKEKHGLIKDANRNLSHQVNDFHSLELQLRNEIQNLQKELNDKKMENEDLREHLNQEKIYNENLKREFDGQRNYYNQLFEEWYSAIMIYVKQSEKVLDGFRGKEIES